MPSPWEKYQQRRGSTGSSGSRNRALAAATLNAQDPRTATPYQSVEQPEIDPETIKQKRQQLQTQQQQKMRGLLTGPASLIPNFKELEKGNVRFGIDEYAATPTQASLEEDPGLNPWSWTMQKVIAPTLSGWQRSVEFSSGLLATPFSTELQAARDAGVGAAERWRNLDLPTMRIGKQKGEGFGFDVGVKGAVELIVDPIGLATMALPIGAAFRTAAYPAKKLGSLVGKVSGLTKMSQKGMKEFTERAKGIDLSIKSEITEMQKGIVDDVWDRNVLVQDHLKETGGGFGNLAEMQTVVTPKTEMQLLMNYDEVMDAKSQLGYMDGLLAYVNQKATDSSKKKMGVFWRALNNPVEKFRPSVGAMQTREGRALYFYNQYKTAIDTESLIKSSNLAKKDFEKVFADMGLKKSEVESFAPGQEDISDAAKLIWKGYMNMVTPKIARESVPMIVEGKGVSSPMFKYVEGLGELTGVQEEKLLINVNTDLGIVNLTTPSGFNLGQLNIKGANSFSGSTEDIIAGLQGLSSDRTLGKLGGKDLDTIRSEINNSVDQLNKRFDLADTNILEGRGRYDYDLAGNSLDINFKGFDFESAQTRSWDLPKGFGGNRKTGKAVKGTIGGDIREQLARDIDALQRNIKNITDDPKRRREILQANQNLINEASTTYNRIINSTLDQTESFIDQVKDVRSLRNMMLRSKGVGIDEITDAAGMDNARAMLGNLNLDDAKSLYKDELNILRNELAERVQFSSGEEALLGLRKLDKGLQNNKLWVDVRTGRSGQKLDDILNEEQWNTVTREVIRQYAKKGENIEFFGRIDANGQLEKIFKKSHALSGKLQYKDLERQFGKMAERVGKGKLTLAGKVGKEFRESKKLLNEEFNKLYGTDITQIEKEMPFLDFLDMAGFTVGHSGSTAKPIRLYETGFFQLSNDAKDYLDYFYNLLDEGGQLMRENGVKFNEIAEYTNGNYVHHMVESIKIAATEAEDVFMRNEGFSRYLQPLSPQSPVKARAFTDSIVEGFEEKGLQYAQDPAEIIEAFTKSVHNQINTHLVANKLRVAAAKDLGAFNIASKKLQPIGKTISLIDDLDKAFKVGEGQEINPDRIKGVFQDKTVEGYIEHHSPDLHRLLKDALEDPDRFTAADVLQDLSKQGSGKEVDEMLKKFRDEMKKEQRMVQDADRHAAQVRMNREEYDIKTGIFGREVKANRLRKVAAHNGSQEGQSVAVLKDLLFDDKVAQKIEDTLGIAKPNTFDKFAESTGKVGDNIRLIQTGIDLGTPLLQGLPTLVRNPALWAKATKNMLTTVFDPNLGGDVARINFFAEKGDVIKRMNRKRVLMASQGQDYFRAVDKGGWSSKALKNIGFSDEQKGVRIAGKLDSGVKRMQMGFEDLGDRIRTGMWESHEPQIIANMSDEAKDRYLKTGQVTGESADVINQQLDELGEYVNQMTGAFSHTQAMIGRRQANMERAFLLFSPAYTRASLGLLGSVLSGGLKGKEAHKTLSRMLMVGVSFHTATAVAQSQGTGKPLEEYLHLDPSKADFLTMQIGEAKVGIGSFWNSTFKAMAQIVADPAFRGDVLDSPLLMTGAGRGQAGFDEQGIRSKLANNPAIRWLRGRSSPAGSQFWNLGMGANFLGEEMSVNSSDFFGFDDGVGGDIAPFWMQNFYDNGLGYSFSALPFEFVGLRTYEMPPWEKRTEIRDEFAMKEYGELWRDLNNVQKRSVTENNQANPSWQRLQELDAEIAEKRRVIGGGELDIKMQDYQIEKDKIDDLYEGQLKQVVGYYNQGVMDSELDRPHIGSPAELIAEEKSIRAERGALMDSLTDPSLNPDYALIEAYYDSFDGFNKLERPEDFFADRYSDIYFDPKWEHIGFFDFKGRDKELQELLSEWGGDAVELEQYAKNLLFGKRFSVDSVVSEYYTGVNKFFTKYYENSHNAIFTQKYRGEFDDLYDTWAKSNIITQRQIEDANRRFSKALDEVGDLRKSMRNIPGNPESIALDAFLYRFQVGGVETLAHNANRNREEELNQRPAMDAYVPEWRVAGQ